MSYITFLFTAEGSAEELIKQELQAVAEGVAASVLQSSMPSNPDITTMHDRSESLSDVNQDSEVQNTDLDLNKASFEVLKLLTFLHTCICFLGCFLLFPSAECIF